MSENRTLNSRYTLDGEIGRGGMGVVYRAEDAQMRRVVAIKTLPSIMTHNQELMRRFNSEIQHASRLEHPNIARVYDVGEDAGTNYYVMQYIDGKSLRELLKEKGRLTLEEALPILEQVASALDYANSQGIIHRDIKPENILLNKAGNAYVVDFGIAKAAEGTRTTRGMLGTPEYMSPEQIRGEMVDGRSDQYSLAVVAYEMLTGQTPFKTEGDDPWAQIQKHLNETVINPRQLGIVLPDNAINSLFKSLNKSSEQRFDDCIDLISGLRDEIDVADSFCLTQKPKYSFYRLLLIAVIAIIIFMAIVIRNKNVTLEHEQKINVFVLKNQLQVAFIRSSEGMRQLCLSSLDGKNQKRISWLPGYFSAYRSEEDKSLISKDLKCIALIAEKGIQVYNNSNVISKIEKNRSNIDEQFGFNPFMILCDISDDGKFITYLDKAKQVIKVAETKSGKIIITREDVFAYDSSGGDITDEYWSSPALSRTGDFIAYANLDGELIIESIKKGGKKIVGRSTKGSRGTAGIYKNGFLAGSRPNVLTQDMHPVFSGDSEEIYYINGDEICRQSIHNKNTPEVIYFNKDNNISFFNCYNGKIILVTSLKNNYKEQYITVIDAQTDETIVSKKIVGGGIGNVVMYNKNVFYEMNTIESSYNIFQLNLNKDKDDFICYGQLVTVGEYPSDLGHQIEEKDISPVGYNASYSLIGSVTADFDADGKMEKAFCANDTSKEGKVVFWVVKDENVKWKSDTDIDNIHAVISQFVARDLNNDGRAELIFDMWDKNWEYGVWSMLKIYRWDDKKFIHITTCFDSGWPDYYDKQKYYINMSEKKPMKLATLGSNVRFFDYVNDRYIQVGKIEKVNDKILRKQGYIPIKEAFRSIKKSE
jgi:serine/threonine protein kinase